MEEATDDIPVVTPAGSELLAGALSVSFVTVAVVVVGELVSSVRLAAAGHVKVLLWKEESTAALARRVAAFASFSKIAVVQLPTNGK